MNNIKEEKIEIPWKNARYWDFYEELYDNNLDLIDEEDLLPEFSQMFWRRFKKEMTDEDIEILLEDMEDSNYHRERKILMEMMPYDDEELDMDEEDEIEWKGIQNYYATLFISQYENNVDDYNDLIEDPKERIATTGYYMNVYTVTSPNEDVRKAAVTPFIEMFWNKYKDKMSTIDVELLLNELYYRNYKTVYSVLYDMVEKDNRETRQQIPIEAFENDNIQDTIEEYINKYGYTYHKLMAEMLGTCDGKEKKEILDDCELDYSDYNWPDEEKFEIVRNYYMNEYRRTKR